MPTDAPARRWSSEPPVPTKRELDTAADRRLYVELGLSPVTCGRCGTEVLVKKNSAKHTSVQWTCDPVANCPEFAEAAAAGRATARVLGCSGLKKSIDDAVADGSLVVPRG